MTEIQYSASPEGHRTYSKAWRFFLSFRCGDVSGQNIRIERKMGVAEYCQILEKNLLPESCQWEEDSAFNINNDPKHTAELTAEWRKVNVLLWPSQSPVLNPVERLEPTNGQHPV